MVSYSPVYSASKLVPLSDSSFLPDLSVLGSAVFAADQRTFGWINCGVVNAS